MVASYRSHTTATNSSGTSYTIARPAGIQAGDILVLAHCTDSGAATTLTAPSGFSVELSQNSGQTYTRGRVFLKTATGSEPATYTLAKPSSDAAAAILVCIQGATVPAVSAVVSSGSGANVSTPSVTPATADGIEVRFAAGDGDGNARTFTAPATYTEPTGADVNSGGYTTLTAAYKVLSSSSATGALNFVASGTMVSRLGFTIWLPSAATSVDATATPGVVSATTSIPSPTVAADTSATATPAVVTATASIPEPAVSIPGISPEVRDTTQAAGRVAAIVCDAPALQAGDLLIAHHTCDYGTPADMSVDGDWLLLDEYTAGFNQHQVKLYWKVADGDEPASWTFTQDENGDGTVIIASVSGASEDEPTVAETGGQSGPTVTTPGITPPSANALELRFAGGVPFSSEARTWTPPAGFDEIADVQSTTYTTASAAVRELSSTAPTGSETFAPSSALDVSAGHTLGVAPGAVDPDATATPATVEASASVPAPTGSAGASASPIVVAATASIPAPTASAGASAAPAVVAASAAIPAPAPSAGSAASPATVQASASIPAPSTSVGSTVTPAVVSASASIPSPTPLAGSTAAPSTVAGSATIPTVQTSAGSTASPSVVTASASIPEPAITAVTTTSPDVVQATASIPGPSVSTGSTATPDVVEVTSTIPAPTTSSGATAEPGVVSATTTIPAPEAGSGSSASPAAVEATASIPQPATSAGATASPDTVQASATIPSPDVSDGALAAELRDDFSGADLDTSRWTATNGAGVTGQQADGVYTFEVGSSAVAYSQLASAGVYDLTGSHYTVELVDAGSQDAGLEVYFIVEADASNRLTMVIAGGFLGIYKTVSGSQTGITFPAYSPTEHRWLRIREDAGTTYWEASPDGSSWAELHSEPTPITVTSTRLSLQAGAWQALGADTAVVWDHVGGPQVVDAAATPETVPATSSIPAPTASAGATATPGVVTASAAIPTATVLTGSTASPSVVAATADVPSPVVSASSTASAAVIEASASIPELDVSAGATVSAAVVAATASIPAPDTSAGSTASPGAVEASAAIPEPTVSRGATATPGIVQASAEIPQPTVQAGGNATATPSTVQATASIPGPAASTSSTASPAVVLATAAVPTPATTVLVAATPAAVEAYASIPAALISTTARPPVVAAVASIPTPSVSTGQVGDIHARLGDPIRRRWTSPRDGPDQWATTAAGRRWSTT